MTTRRYPSGAPAPTTYGTQLPIGAVVGEYVIDGWAASGGMATVYVAHHPSIGKRAAVKVISSELASDPVCVERFLQEARSAGQIRHPNVVEVFGFGTLPDGRSYSIMEWLEGETLGQRMGRPLSIDEGCEILIQVCDALAATHECGVIHRDLKPENIFLEEIQGGRKVVKLLDFGIAKRIAPPGGKQTRLTAEHSTLGTAEYLSPEQATGRPIGPPSDVYSLGVMAYEMFLGALPFDGATPVEVMYQHIHSEPPSPASRQKHLPRALEELLWSMLAKDPLARPEVWAVRAALVGMPIAVVSEEVIPRPSGPIEIAGEAIANEPGFVTAPVDEVGQVADDETDDDPKPTWNRFKRQRAAPLGGQRMRTVGIVTAAGVLIALLLPSLRRGDERTPEASPLVAAAAATPIVAAAPPAPEPTVAPPAPLVRVLSVLTNVGHARIALDGRTIADRTASARLTLPDDRVHAIEITAAGFKPTAQKVSVLPGQTVELNVRLQRKTTLPREARRSSYIIDSTGAVR